MFSKKSVTRGLFAASALALLAAGCDAGTATPMGVVSGGGAIDPATALAEARQVTEAAFKGTNRPVDPTSRPAVKGKKLAIVVSGMAASSSKIPALAAEEAARALGWDVTIYDGGLNASRYPELVRQATAAGADGIILTAIDCNYVKQPLIEARAKGVAISTIYSFDCNDPRTGDASEPLFSANPNYGPEATDVVGFVEAYGGDQASYIIADSNNQAKIIEVLAPELTIVNHTSDGFRKRIQRSGGSEIVATVEVTVADIATQQVRPKVENELLRHPEANWIKSPFTFATTTGIVPALGSQAGTIKVMGGEGFVEETDLVHEGKVTAANVVSAAWNGWIAVDVLNSVWRNEQPVDSGLGWTLIDKDHGLPGEGRSHEPEIDFRAAYRKAWRVG
jgi:ribose transport system substrate-binding protein